MIHKAVRDLCAVAPQLTDDLDQARLTRGGRLHRRGGEPLSEATPAW